MSDETAVADRIEANGCMREWVYSIYADGELDTREMREVESHVERCAVCRERVAALRVEATALRAALQVDEVALAPVSRTAAARSLAIGAISAVGVAFASLSALGWLFQSRLPAPLAWLDPLNLDAPFALLFDLLSVLSDGGHAMGQVVVPLSALLLLAMVLSAAAGRPGGPNGSRTAALLFAVSTTALSLLWPARASAIEFRFREEAAIIPAGEVVEQTWVVQADTVTVEGTLRGDLVAVAERVIISGLLEGNLVSGARRVEVSGRVTGSVIAAGERVRISGKVDRNVYAASDQTSVEESGRVGHDLLGLGEGVEISGRVGRDAMTLGTWLDVRGEIGRDLAMRVERAELMGDARIGGDVHATYTEEKAGIQIDPRASIGGETTIEPVEAKGSSVWDRYSSPEYYLFRAISFAAAFLFGMVMFRLAPWVFGSEIRTGVELFRFLGIGLAGLVLVPVSLALLAATLVGIPVAIAGLLAFAIGAYSANIVVGAIVGRSLVGRDAELDWRGFAKALVAGLAIVFVALALPYLGGVLRFLALLLGFGVIAERSWARLRA
ncbi:MAG: zf-HC2 domain-containing protein [Myxococcota bacterium]